MSDTFKKVVTNTSINTFGLIAQLIINLYIFSKITLVLGVEQLGLIAISSLFSVLGLVSLLDFGVPGALTREMSASLKKHQFMHSAELFWGCFIFFIVIGFTVSGLLLTLAPFFVNDILNVSPNFREPFLNSLFFVLVSHCFQFPSLILKAAFRAHSLFGRLQGVLVGNEVVRAILVTLLLNRGFGFESVVVINGVVPLLSFAILWVILPKQAIPVGGSAGFIVTSFKTIQRLASQIFAQRISASVYNGTDRLLSAIMLGPAAVGILEVCSKFPLMFNRALGLSVSAVVPAISGFSLKSQEQFSLVVNLYKTGFKIYYLLVAPPVVCILFFTNSILPLWVDIEDEIVVDCMRIMCLWCLVFPLNFGGNFLIALDNRVSAYTSYIISLPLIKLLSIVILIPYIGIYAFPISFLIASLAILYLIFTMQKVIGVGVCFHVILVFKILLASVAPLPLIAHLDIGSSTLVGLAMNGAMTYALQVLLIYFLILGEQERRKIHSFFRYISN